MNQRPALLALGLSGLCLLSLGVGAVQLGPLEVTQALFGQTSSLNQQILLELRVPRMLLAVLTGAMLAVSGTILQSIIRNPLASPDLVGVGAGAGLAAVGVLVLLPNTPYWVLPVTAFFGAWLGFAVVYALARRNASVSPIRLALIGIAVTASLSSLQQLLLIRAPEDLSRTLSFLAGTVYGADWIRVERLAPVFLLIPAIMFFAKRMDVLGFSDQTIVNLGMRLELARLVLLSLAVALAASAISAVGTLGFVGLLAPHAARLLVGSKHLILIPTSALLGSSLVVFADILGRGLFAPLDIPVGIVTTLLGVPYFLYLLQRSAQVRL
jgi:ABC-type Fe3+-siderophore transport system permease subunit